MTINRRKFLELTATLAGSSAVASAIPWIQIFNAPPAMGMNPSDRVRLGIVGMGSRGTALMWNIRSFGERLNVEIAAVCDNHPPHLERAMERTGAPGFSDHRTMLEQVELDGVVIATPLHQHMEPTVDAMEHGVHVFCEKAMERTLDRVKRMYDAHVEHDRILIIGHQRLCSPVYLEAIDRIRRGEYGPITMLMGNWHRNISWIQYNTEPLSDLDRHLNWRLYRKSSAGMITELCSHHLQIANWVKDAQPVSVTGSGSINFWKDHREVWDNFSLVFKYADGTHFKYSCLQSNKHNGMRIMALGNKGTLDLEVNKAYLENPPEAPAIRKLIHNLESRLFDTIPIGGATWIPAEPVAYGGEFISGDWELNETQLLLEAFVNYIREGRAPERLTIEGYDASTWSLLAEDATYSDHKISLPEEYYVPRTAAIDVQPGV